MGSRLERESLPWRGRGAADLLLLALFLLPNFVTLHGGFVWDDLPQLVEDDRVHSLARLGDIWTRAYWPAISGAALYRPLSKSLWSVLWAIGGGSPWVFHLGNLALGGAAVLLVRRVLVRAAFGETVSFIAAALFALFPIHSEATATVVGSAELLAAVLCLASLDAWQAGKGATALGLLVAAVLSKESAAAFPFAALLAFGAARPARERLRAALAAVVVAVAAVAANQLVSAKATTVPPLFNPLVTLAPGWRAINALWIQVLYLFKTVFPLHLSADYSFNQIPAVVSAADPRAWAALALPAVAVVLCLCSRAARPPVLLAAVSFAPTANVLFPIGTIMGERLAYLPSLGVALGGALLLARVRWVPVLAALALLFGARTFERNLSWADSDRFTAALVRTAPRSANAWFSRAAFLAWRGEDAAAVEHYDRGLSILPRYPEALFNRANSLVVLGRFDEAAAGYRACLAVAPGHSDAELALDYLSRGISFRPRSPGY